MNNLIPVVENHNNNLVVSSRIVAKQLNKRHTHVIRDLEQILESPNLGSLKNNDRINGNKDDTNMILENSNVRSLIIKNKYSVEGQKRTYKEYLLTKDGFILYMFNIQGHNDFKMAYINKFNEMEKEIISQQSNLLENRKQEVKLLTTQAKATNARARLTNAETRKAREERLLRKLTLQEQKLAIEIENVSILKRTNELLLKQLEVQSIEIKLSEEKRLKELEIQNQKDIESMPFLADDYSEEDEFKDIFRELDNHSKNKKDYYTATDIANEVGLDKAIIGTLAIKNQLKIDLYGKWENSKRYNGQRYTVFRYNERGRTKLLELAREYKAREFQKIIDEFN